MVDFLYIALVLGVLAGSFLNVVIYRLPLMLERQQEEWINEVAPGTFDLGEKVTLSLPASRCPSCKSPIKWYQNIPLLSWLWLLGESACCRRPISMQYPVTELVAGLLGIFVATHYGMTLEAVLMFTAGCLLYALAMIDSKHMLLPDPLVAALVITGLIYQIYVLDSHHLASTVQSMVAVYIGAVCISTIGAYIAKQDVLGFGDVKLLIAIAAWIGGLGVVWVVQLASLAILVIYVVDSCDRKTYPFGPSLCAAAVIVFYNIESLNQYLLGF